MKKYVIEEENLKELIKDSWELTRLINNGVDNWEGYAQDDEDEEGNISVKEYIIQNYKEYEEK